MNANRVTETENAAFYEKAERSLRTLFDTARGAVDTPAPPGRPGMFGE